VAEFALTGNESTRVFHTFVAGKIGQSGALGRRRAGAAGIASAAGAARPASANATTAVAATRTERPHMRRIIG
jgi:hypothetical protein